MSDAQLTVCIYTTAVRRPRIMILVLSLTIDDQPIEHDELRLLCWVTGSRKGIFFFFFEGGNW
jgi:hypothetical protein